MKSHPSCGAFANTHSGCPYPFFPFTARVRTLQVPPSVSLGPRVLQPLTADAWSDPSVFFVFSPYFSFYRDIGSPFPSPVHALISDGWVQPSQPTPTPALSSSLSGCLLTNAMPSLSSPHAVPIALSAVAVLLLCFWNELLGIEVEDKTHHHHPTQPVVHLTSCAALLSDEGGVSYNHRGPS